jgi:hypothetical protein
LTGVPGFFIPKHFPRTRVFHAATISGAQLLTSGPVLTDVTAVGRGHLQISEGCACFCGFCAESFVRKPYRELDADTVRSAALDAKKNMAVYDCELYSFNFSMHRNWYRIQADLASLFPSIGLKSQRFDAIANGSIIFRSPFRFNPDGYCKTKGIKYTMRKTGEGAYRCEFSKESLKKKILAGLSLVIHPSRWVVTVTPEPKFRAEGFAQSAFDLPDPAEWVRIGMNAVFAETTGIQRTDFSL